jgi:hypothetical protein
MEYFIKWNSNEQSTAKNQREKKQGFLSKLKAGTSKLFSASKLKGVLNNDELIK